MDKIIKSVSMRNEVVAWLKQFPNQSEEINRILLEAMNYAEDPEIEFNRLNKELDFVNKQMVEFLEKMGEIKEEGNRKEQEQAETILLKAKEKKEERRKSLYYILQECKKQPEWVEFLGKASPVEIEHLIKYTNLWREREINVGWSNLREILMIFDENELVEGVHSQTKLNDPQKDRS